MLSQLQNYPAQVRVNLRLIQVDKMEFNEVVPLDSLAWLLYRLFHPQSGLEYEELNNDGLGSTDCPVPRAAAVAYLA